MDAAFMSQSVNSNGGSLINDTNDTCNYFRGILPRRRGAAGVRGLGKMTNSFGNSNPLLFRVL